MVKATDKKEKNRLIAGNKKAYHDYFVDEKLEAGVELFGTEVKSVRAGNVNLKDSYCSFKNGEIFALGVHISPYEKGNVFNKEPLRPKKLLLHKREILRLSGRAAEDGVSIIPLSLYFSGSRVKMEIGLCRGKNSMTNGKIWPEPPTGGIWNGRSRAEIATSDKIRLTKKRFCAILTVATFKEAHCFNGSVKVSTGIFKQDQRGVPSNHDKGSP